MAYLDAAQERISERAAIEQVRIADAVRAASAAQGEYTRWRDRVLRAAHKTAARPNPAALEAGVMALAATHPEYVVFGGPA